MCKLVMHWVPLLLSGVFRNSKIVQLPNGAEKNSAFQTFGKKIFAICRKSDLMTSGVENDTTRILYVLYSNFFTCRAGCAIILVHVSLLSLPCFRNLWPPFTPSTMLVNNKQQQMDATQYEGQCTLAKAQSKLYSTGGKKQYRENTNRDVLQGAGLFGCTCSAKL